MIEAILFVIVIVGGFALGLSLGTTIGIELVEQAEDKEKKNGKC